MVSVSSFGVSVLCEEGSGACMLTNMGKSFQHTKTQKKVSPMFAHLRPQFAQLWGTGVWCESQPIMPPMRTCDVPGHVGDSRAHHCKADAKWPTVAPGTM